MAHRADPLEGLVRVREPERDPERGEVARCHPESLRVGGFRFQTPGTFQIVDHEVLGLESIEWIATIRTTFDGDGRMLYEHDLKREHHDHHRATTTSRRSSPAPTRPSTDGATGGVFWFQAVERPFHELREPGRRVERPDALDYGVGSQEIIGDERAEVVGELGQGAWAENRHGPVRARPRDGDLAWAGAQFASDGEYRVEYLCALRRVLGLKHATAEAFGTAFFTFAIFSGEHPATQRRPRDDAVKRAGAHTMRHSSF